MITQKLVKEFFDYNPTTGALFRKERDLKWFPSKATWKMWNKRFANQELDRKNDKGYKRVFIEGVDYPLHRIIWLWMTGVFPENQIDHINQNKTDNKWENLREVKNSENCKNQKLRSTNKTGIIGTHKLPSGNIRASITVNGLRIKLGTYTSLEEARLVRKTAEQKYGFHKNHGSNISQ